MFIYSVQKFKPFHRFRLNLALSNYFMFNKNNVQNNKIGQMIKIIPYCHYIHINTYVDLVNFNSPDFC